MTHFPNCTLRFESFEKAQLQNSLNSVSSLAEQHNLTLGSCVQLPIKRKRITLLRSPHIDKKSREQFETLIHRRLVSIKATNESQKLDSFIVELKNSLPASISVKIRFYNYN